MVEVDPAPDRHLPLAKLHRRWGARWATIDGVEAPADYGAPNEEYAALREGCALVDRSDVGRLELMGEDRQRFLNGLVTCDVKPLGAGEGAYGYFTDRQGKILSDVVVLALADRLWLELPPSAGETVRAQLQKYIIADRVEVKPLDDLVLWTIAGPRARPFLAAISSAPPPDAPWSHRKTVIDGSEVQWVRQARLGVEAWTLWMSASIARGLAESLVQRGADWGLRPVGRTALEAVRVEEAIGRFGRDFGPANFPQEVGEGSAVSYAKGCYLGQEIVARIHYRGGVNHRLTGLEFEAPSAPRAGSSLLLEDREVGTVSSAVESPRGGWIGLAMIHRRGWDAAEFSTAGGVARTRGAPETKTAGESPAAESTAQE
jgi:folate-binding protein YgfZ